MFNFNNELPYIQTAENKFSFQKVSAIAQRVISRGSADPEPSSNEGNGQKFPLMRFLKALKISKFFSINKDYMTLKKGWSRIVLIVIFFYLIFRFVLLSYYFFFSF
jgi:hypothetical protein